ncbi:hypothetical protein EK599_10935 [Vibrio sp. T187]|uniref:hypothetical protein n=1 Tax=Vibrio TaxID=662 RepID=UPI0010C94D34|nr:MULTISPECIES: hypothetical protein [Vibrio]MBW3696215.1 hypothetical protein [Vibrio sp. T187]
MNNEIPDIAHKKNLWLLSQIDVQFPTKESLAGSKLYQESLFNRQVQPFTPSQPSHSVDEICLVDFHKMTVMFSLNQASSWKSKADQANMLEFFTQIILSDEHNLYLGLTNGEVVASAIVTAQSDELLISDITNLSGDKVEFACQLVNVWEQDHSSSAKYWAEV